MTATPHPQLAVTLNGHSLAPDPNSSFLFNPGVQPAEGVYPPEQWSAWVVPPGAAVSGNNTLELALQTTLTAATDLLQAGAKAAHRAGETPVDVSADSATAGTGTARSGIPVGRGPFNNTDLQPAETYMHTYKVYADKRAGALACQAECDGDTKCAAWSYVAPA